MKNKWRPYTNLMVHFLKANLIHDRKELLDQINSIFEDIVIDIGCIEFDAYTIGRLFRKYRDNSCSKNIILYAGNHHIENFRNFFENYLGAEAAPKMHNDDRHQCVNISKKILCNFIDLEGLNRVLSSFKKNS